MKYKAALEAFLCSKNDYTVLYKSLKHVCPVSRILVLDSSFNPPHMAHFALAKEAIDHDFDGSAANSTSKNSPKMLLLLLSVKNADKVVPKPALFEHRLEMMHLMASALEKLDVAVSIGLTKHAKFADKSAAIQSYLSRELEMNVSPARLTFLLGFDTLIRILDPKYYAPTSLADALDRFMYNTDLFCLTRAGSVQAFNEQQEYIDRIAHGEFPDIPRLWAQNITLKTVDSSRDTIGSISSSRIRDAYISETEPRNPPVLEEIDFYIRSRGLYSEKS